MEVTLSPMPRIAHGFGRPEAPRFPTESPDPGKWASGSAFLLALMQEVHDEYIRDVAKAAAGMPTESDRVDFLAPIVIARVALGAELGGSYFLDLAAVLEEGGWLNGRR
jgi:hypothetical protein